MESKDCVLLKKKEYDELVKKANSKKPEYICIRIYGEYNMYTDNYSGIDSSLSLSGGIKKQIFNISNMLRDKIRSEQDIYEKGIREEIADELSVCNYWGIKKWIKNNIKK